MKTVEFVLADTTYYLCLNGSALFSCYDHLGTDFIEKISGDTKDSFEATCWMLSTLAMQGEIVRRWEGLDKGPMLSSQKAAALLMPQDVVRAREAILSAYDLAFQRETATDDEEIDLGLLELQKKNGKGPLFSSYLQWITQFLRMSIRDGLMLTPGMLLDLIDLEIDRRGLRKKEDT